MTLSHLTMYGCNKWLELKFQRHNTHDFLKYDLKNYKRLHTKEIQCIMNKVIWFILMNTTFSGIYVSHSILRCSKTIKIHPRQLYCTHNQTFHASKQKINAYNVCILEMQQCIDISHTDYIVLRLYCCINIGQYIDVSQLVLFKLFDLW